MSDEEILRQWREIFATHGTVNVDAAVVKIARAIEAQTLRATLDVVDAVRQKMHDEPCMEAESGAIECLEAIRSLSRKDQ